MTSFCFFVQLADRTLILKQKEFLFFNTPPRLFAPPPLAWGLR